MIVPQAQRGLQPLKSCPSLEYLFLRLYGDYCSPTIPNGMITGLGHKRLEKFIELLSLGNALAEEADGMI
jgi:hypothetical protein